MKQSHPGKTLMRRQNTRSYCTSNNLPKNTICTYCLRRPNTCQAYISRRQLNCYMLSNMELPFDKVYNYFHQGNTQPHTISMQYHCCIRNSCSCTAHTSMNCSYNMSIGNSCSLMLIRITDIPYRMIRMNSLLLIPLCNNL